MLLLLNKPSTWDEAFNRKNRLRLLSQKEVLLFFDLNFLFDSFKKFSKTVRRPVTFCFHALLMRFQRLSHARGNKIRQSPIWDFAEFLLVAGRSYQEKKNS